MPVRVLIVDDHTLVRAGLARLLQGFADVQLVAEASNAEQALQLALQHAPDVVLMDLSLPGRTGLEALSDIRLRAPGTRVVMMTMHDDAAHVRDALDRGAVGFVVKDAAPQELELALRAAHAGQVFLSPQISAKMLAPMLGREKPTGIAALSPRQRDPAPHRQGREQQGNRRRPRHQRQDSGNPPRTHDGVTGLPSRQRSAAVGRAPSARAGVSASLGVTKRWLGRVGCW